jgi:hypothetical protein
MLFREIISVYCENNAKPIDLNKNATLETVKTAGYSAD